MSLVQVELDDNDLSVSKRFVESNETDEEAKRLLKKY